MSASLNLLNPTAISAGTGTRIGYSTERASSGQDLFRTTSSRDFDRALQQQVQRREDQPQQRTAATEPRPNSARNPVEEKARTAESSPEARNPAPPRTEGAEDKAAAQTSTDTPPQTDTATTAAIASEDAAVDPSAGTRDEDGNLMAETTSVQTQATLPEQIAALLAQSPIKAEPATANLAALPAALAALDAHRNALHTPLHSDASAMTTSDQTVAGNLQTAGVASLLSDTAAPDGSNTDAPMHPSTTTTDDSPAKSLQNRALLLGDARTAANDTARSPATDASVKLAEQLTPAIGKAAMESAGADTQGLQSSGNGQSGQATLQPGHAAFHALVRSAASNQHNVPQLPVHTPAGQPAWAQDVGNQVHWMLGRAENKAELVLTPPNMGKLEVSISLNGDQTTAQFIAASQAARDALEQAMPRLREILQQAGISLGETQVSTSGEQRTQDGQQDGSKQHGERLPGGVNEVATASTPVAAIRRHDGMVDTFV